MLASEALLKAKEILSDEKNWCRSGYYANDSLGNNVDPTNKIACKFCTIGSLYKVMLPEQNKRERLFVLSPESFAIDSDVVEKYVRPAVSMNSYYGGEYYERDKNGMPPWSSIISFNDSLATHAQLMEMFDKAIELAKADNN